MKTYWKISGPNKAPKSYCTAFYKYDGSNIRIEWSKKKGWHKFGSRNVLIDETSFLGESISLFQNTYAEDLSKIIKDNKIFRGADSVTAFCEFYGEKSFAGYHEPGDEMKIILFDMNINKKGIMPPRDFIKTFGKLEIPEVIYEGIFGPAFVQDIKDGKYTVKEGVVAKGVNQNKKKSQHSLWMAKVKTKWWIDELKNKALKDAKLSSVLQDNMQEQRG
jgi:hypothetical protein